MKRILALTFILAMCRAGFGQTAARVDIPLQTYGPTVPVPAGPLPQTLWVSNATAYLCVHPSATLAACQASLITTYTDSTEGTACPTSAQIVQLPGTTCTASTGTAANVGAWVSNSLFDYWIASSYGTRGPFTYNPPSNGSASVTGVPIYPSAVNNVYQIDGVANKTIAAAISTCLASTDAGCTIDALGSGNVAKPLACSNTSDITQCPDYIGSFDAVRNCSGTSPTQTCTNVPITLLLGPWNDYTVGTITLERGMQIIGTGSTGASTTGTVMTSISATNAPVFSIAQNNNQPAVNVLLQGFAVNAYAGNTTQDGADLECVLAVAPFTQLTNTGLWNSVWQDLNFSGFMGNTWNFNCSPSTGASAIQFDVFAYDQVTRPVGAGYMVYIAGSVSNDLFLQGLYNNVIQSDTTGPNGAVDFYIGGAPSGSKAPASINFDAVTIQGGAVLVNINGAGRLNFNNMHHEGAATTNGYLITRTGNTAANGEINVDGSYFSGVIGTTASTGYIFNLAGTNTGTAMNVLNTTWFTPTNVVIGAGYTANPQMFNAHDNFGGGIPVTSGVIPKLTAASTITTGTSRVVEITSTTPITTINDYMMPGEILTTIAFSNGVNFATGGNLSINGSSSLTLSAGQSATWWYDDTKTTGVLYLINTNSGNFWASLNAPGLTITGIANANAPAGTANNSTGTLSAGSAYTAALSCVDGSGLYTTVPTNVAGNVTTSGGASSISWAYTIPTNCSTPYLWMRNGAPPFAYFTQVPLTGPFVQLNAASTYTPAAQYPVAGALPTQNTTGPTNLYSLTLGGGTENFGSLGSGGNIVEASALGTAADCANWAATGIGDAGSPCVQRAYLTSAYTNSTVTPSTIMSFSVAASTKYAIRCHGLYMSAASGYFGLTLTGPASPTLVTYDFNKGTAITSNAVTYLDWPATGSSYPSGIGETVITTAATDMPWDLTIGFTNGTTPGTLAIQGLTVSTDTVTVEAGSFCTMQ